MAAAEKYEPYDFANRRHIGPSPEEMAEMLRIVGVSNLDQLIAETVPEAIRQKVPLDFGLPLSERGVLDRMRATANKNRMLTSLIGQGYHGGESFASNKNSCLTGFDQEEGVTDRALLNDYFPLRETMLPE